MLTGCTRRRASRRSFRMDLATPSVTAQIPGFGSEGMNIGRDIIAELRAEKDSLDASYVHCQRLLEEEIQRVQQGDFSQQDPNKKQVEKIFIPYEDQKKHNLVGRLLGPKGLTLKRIQAETQTKMSILGRGSIRDKAKEEELRNSSDPAYSHLHDNLHILIEAMGPYSNVKLAAGVSEVRKMLIPPEPGQPDLTSKYQDQPGFDGFPQGPQRGPPPPPPMSPHGGGGMRGRGGPGRGKPPFQRGGGGGGMGRFGGGRGGGGGGGGRGGGRPRVGGRGRGGFEMYDQGRYMGDSRSGGGGGYGGGGSMGSYGRESFGSEPPFSSHPSESDQYYSSFSDPQPSGGGSYGHGGGSDWKSPRPGRRDFRHHPYQQSSGSYY